MIIDESGSIPSKSVEEEKKKLEKGMEELIDSIFSSPVDMIGEELKEQIKRQMMVIVEASNTLGKMEGTTMGLQAVKNIMQTIIANS